MDPSLRLAKNLPEHTYEYDSANLVAPALAEFREILHYRDLWRLLVSSSIKTRYKRSSLGVLWTLFNPLLNTLVLTIAFSQIMRFKLTNYPIYILSGMILWNFFTQVTNQSMESLVWGSNLLKRIYMPKTIFALAVLGNAMINLILSLLPLVVIALVMGHPITTAILFLPVSMILIGLFTLGVSLLLSTFAVYFVDIIDIFRVILSAWFFLTPIIYPLEIIPADYLPIVRLNPVIYFLELFRDPIYSGTIPSLPVIGLTLGLALLSFVIGWWLFTKKADEFAYFI